LIGWIVFGIFLVAFVVLVVSVFRFAGQINARGRARDEAETEQPPTDPPER
jgi:hypothetical protein